MTEAHTSEFPQYLKHSLGKKNRQTRKLHSCMGEQLCEHYWAQAQLHSLNYSLLQPDMSNPPTHPTQRRSPLAGVWGSHLHQLQN